VLFGWPRRRRDVEQEFQIIEWFEADVLPPNHAGAVDQESAAAMFSKSSKAR
jgi:hypothetical protein